MVKTYCPASNWRYATFLRVSSTLIKKKKKCTSQADLMNALSFTSDDLEANRNGYLTAPQRRRLLIGHASRLAVYGCFVLVAAAFCFSYVSDLVKGSKSVGLNLFFSSVATLAALGFFIFKLWRYHSEARQGVFRVLIGPVHLTFQNSKSAPRVLQIKDLELVIPDVAVQAFAEGGTYRIFYTPYSKTILSAERYVNEESGSADAVSTTEN